MNEYKPGTIVTYTGKFVDPLNLWQKDIYLADIAHALAMKCRFTGHCKAFYSVAQHCCLAAINTQGSTEEKAASLLHDAAEAYLFDIPTLLKQSGNFDDVLLLELKVSYTIQCKYLSDDTKALWDVVDHQLLINECRALLTNWEHIPVANELPTINIPIEPWTWQEAERTFLALAATLGIKD